MTLEKFRKQTRFLSRSTGGNGGGSTTYVGLTDTINSLTGQKGSIPVVNEAGDALIQQSAALSSGMLEKPTFSIAGTNLTINADGIAQIYNSTATTATISRRPVPAKVIDLSTLTDGQTAQIIARDNAGTMEYFLTAVGTETDEIIEALAFEVGNIDDDFEVNRFENARAITNAIINRNQTTDPLIRVSGFLISNPSGSQIEISSGVMWGNHEKSSESLVNTSVVKSLLYDGLASPNSTVITGWNNTQFVDSGGNLQTLTANRFAVNWVFRLITNEPGVTKIVILLGAGDFTQAQAISELGPKFPNDVTDKFGELVGKIIIQKDASTAFSVESIDERGRGGLNLQEVIDANIIPVATDATLTGDGTGGDPLSVSTFTMGFDANDAIYPSTNPAVADSRNGHPVIAFDDSAAENVLFSSIFPANYNGGDISVNIDWVAETATTGGVTWGIEFERNAPAGTDIDADSFAAQQAETSTTSGTSGIITRTTITLTQAEADAIAALDSYRMRLQRIVGDVGDDMTGDAQVLRIGVS